MSNIKDTLEQRGGRYGTMEDNAKIVQSLLRVLESNCKWDHLSDFHKETIHMIFHKISRMVCGDQNYADNVHDIAGYATLLEEWLNESN